MELFDDNLKIDPKFIIKLTDSIFRFALNFPQIKNNSEEFEHLSLKYISYLVKYKNNPPKAYF